MEIDDLPDDILLEIFDYLDSKDLVNAADTCEKYDNLHK